MPVKAPLAFLALAILFSVVLAHADPGAQSTPVQAAATQTAPTQTAPIQAQGSEKPPPAALKPAAPDFSKEAYTLERLSTHITEEDDGTGAREVTAEVKILADAGVKAFAVLSFTYTSANETVEFDYVRVRKPDGTVVKTPDYNIQDMPGEVTRTAPLYSDIHEKHVAVKGLGVGDVLEYLVRYRVVKAQVPGHFWYEYFFTKTAIAKDERLEISVPSAKYVKVVSPEFKPEITEEGTRRIYRWKHANLELKEKDPDEVPRRTPPNPDVQLTTFASWEDVGRWYGGLQKDALAVTPPIQAKAAELTKGLQTDDEKIHAIYNFVALKVHYIGLDFGIGRYQPHAADDVLDNGYGDCKDKHTLLATLLSASGVEAWPALINASRKLDPDVPSPAQFNHVITVVPKAGGYTWLDTTPEIAPYGLLLLLLRDKQALVIPTSKAPVLMTTPENPPFAQSQEFTMQGKLGADGTFTGHAEHSYRGDAEVLLRLLFRQVSQSQWKEATQRFSYGMNFGGDVSNVKATPPDELDKPFDLSYDYVRKNYSDWDQRQITPPLPPMGIEVAKGAKDVKPEEPVLLGALGKVIYRSRVELPQGYSAVAPASCHVTEPFAEYSSNTAIEGGVMTTTRELVVKKNEVALSDWESYRKFGRAISDDESNYIRLSGSSAVVTGKADADEVFWEGSNAMQGQDFRKAEVSFQKVIAAQPNYPLVHLNLGSTMLMQGKVDAALVEFHKEQEVSPDELRAYQVPATYLVRVGRLDDAIGECRRLLKVHPENFGAALLIGQALIQEGKYPQAAAELENALKVSPTNRDLQFTLGSAYLKAGQSEQGVNHIRAVVEERGKTAAGLDTLNSAAYTLAEAKTGLDLARQYAENAVKQLDERAGDDVAAEDTGTRSTYQYSLLWDTLGWVYFQSGDISRSENFVHAAWILGQDPIVGEHLGEIYEKQGKSEEAEHAYELALAAQGYPPLQVAPQTIINVPLSRPIDETNYQDERDKILSRYQKLTGQAPKLEETNRLPNGQWTKTPAEQLSQMRSVHLGKMPNLSGSAEFSIVFAPERVESVQYLRGEESLEALADKLKAAHYQVAFPVGSKAKIFRRAQLSCTPSAGCMAVLVPPERARPR